MSIKRYSDPDTYTLPPENQKEGIRLVRLDPGDNADSPDFLFALTTGGGADAKIHQYLLLDIDGARMIRQILDEGITLFETGARQHQ